MKLDTLMHTGVVGFVTVTRTHDRGFSVKLWDEDNRRLVSSGHGKTIEEATHVAVLMCKDVPRLPGLETRTRV